MLNNGGESGPPCLIPDLSGNFNIENDDGCGFFIYGLYYVEMSSLYANFLENFYHKWLLNFVKGFFASTEMIIWFFSFSLLICFITLTDLCILKNLCIPEINPS